MESVAKSTVARMHLAGGSLKSWRKTEPMITLRNTTESVHIYIYIIKSLVI